MKKPALVIMAAGMGSRYGGLKQIDPVGPNGEIIIDYSIYDALKAGFDKVVFIIKEEIEEAFREVIGSRIEKKVETAYVFQDIDDLPEGFTRPAEREKPWGTGHAVLSCRGKIDRPFSVINADDFYGRDSFQVLYDYLKDIDDVKSYNYAMVGFILKNTLTEHGYVSRGICQVNSQGYLEDIKERTKIQRFSDGVKYQEDGEWITIPENSIVSMNMWGFTPSIFDELETGFSNFLEKNKDNIEKAEFFLPNLVGDLVTDDKAKVKVLTSNERWYGVTYKEDKPIVKKAIGELIKQGIYPDKL
ncbi:MAG: sugar phosphate nucleotidyltransferase [Caldicoprobacterales bacterium]